MRSSHKVLVCGGRDYRDTKRFERVMCELDNRVSIGEIIHCGANGADTMAGCWADKYNIPVTVFKADWSRHGRAAGPRRNEKMLYEGKPDFVIAFPGGRGTAHMVRIAKAAGIKVYEVPALDQTPDIYESSSTKQLTNGDSQ
jgi:hypothetical protein